MVVGLAILSVQLVYIITKVIRSKYVHGVVYSILHYVIKFVSYLQQVDRWFSLDTLVSSNKNKKMTATI
jgi:uncharacterized membrane protein YraQ (UPF0718 family)